MEVEQLKLLLEEKEHIVQVTAELGQSLLQKNKQLEEDYSRISKQLQEQTNLLEELQRKAGEYEKDLKEKNKLIEELQFHQTLNEEKHSQDVASLEMAEKKTFQLMESLQMEQSKNKKLQTELLDLFTCKEQLKRSENDIAELNQKYKLELEKSALREKDIKRLNSELSLERQQSKATLEEMNKKVRDLEYKVQTLQKNIQSEIMTDTYIEIEELRIKNQNLTLENEKLMKSLLFMDQNIQSKEIEYQNLLSNAQAELAALKEFNSPPQSPQKGNNSDSINSNINDTVETIKSSIFDELSVEIEKQVLERTINEETNQKSQIEAFLNSKLTATENYFFLTACAVKINLAVSRASNLFCNYTLQYPKGLSISSLYKKAVNEEIPFHEWHNWLKKQFLLVALSADKESNANTKNNNNQNTNQFVKINSSILTKTVKATPGGETIRTKPTVFNMGSSTFKRKDQESLPKRKVENFSSSNKTNWPN